MSGEDLNFTLGRMQAELTTLRERLEDLNDRETEQNALLTQVRMDVAAIRAQARVIGAIAGSLSGAVTALVGWWGHTR